MAPAVANIDVGTRVILNPDLEHGDPIETDSNGFECWHPRRMFRGCEGVVVARHDSPGGPPYPFFDVEVPSDRHRNGKTTVAFLTDDEFAVIKQEA